MPTVASYRRAPLMDPAFVPLTDASVHVDGAFQKQIETALKFVNIDRMTALDAVLATRLGDYSEMPAMPDLNAVSAMIRTDPAAAARMLRAACMVAVAGRDPQNMRSVLDVLLSFLNQVASMPEEKLFAAGADILRVTVEMYRRTGHSGLLQGLENLRAYLPDVSGLMHVFPFQREYTAPRSASAEEKAYHERMQRFATGALMADALAMTTLLSQFSGSGKDSSAARAGLNAIKRYHGMPGGAFYADPLLAGRDPARAADLQSVCCLCEALFDILCQEGSAEVAEQLELLIENAIPDLLSENGVRVLMPSNRLADDDSCKSAAPTDTDITALLKAMYAVRRSIWLAGGEDTLAYMLPMSGGCLTRLGGVPVRFTSRVEGFYSRRVTITCECKEEVGCTLILRVPSYVSSATISLNGAASRPAHSGEMLRIRRTFRNGDTLVLEMNVAPRMETGYRSSVYVMAGSKLMALCQPDTSSGWQYALVSQKDLTPVEENGSISVLSVASPASEWGTRDGFILPPPQGITASQMYELTLLPAAGTNGRITVFPRAEVR